MWRALIFIAILAAGAVAAVWLADQPGTVVVTFAGYEARTTVESLAARMSPADTEDPDTEGSG